MHTTSPWWRHEHAVCHCWLLHGTCKGPACCHMHHSSVHLHSVCCLLWHMLLLLVLLHVVLLLLVHAY
jgi:hypothetical protein